MRKEYDFSNAKKNPMSREQLNTELQKGIGQIKDEQMRKMLLELSQLLIQAYGPILKSIILYGSVARGIQTDESDIDIMILIDGDRQKLRQYEDKLSDVSTDMALKYVKVFSIMDVSYEEYKEWKQVSPFYRNVSEEGVVLYVA